MAVPKYMQDEEVYTADEFFDVTAGLDEYAELINGEIVMQGAPNEKHHDIASGIFVKFFNFIASHKGKCKPYIAPFDVVLNETNVVQPDVFILCDRSKSDGKKIYDSPDLVVEVTSSNRDDDYSRKLRLYSESGVGEYWIIDPDKRQTAVCLFRQPVNIIFCDFDKPVPVSLFGGELEINIAELLGE